MASFLECIQVPEIKNAEMTHSDDLGDISKFLAVADVLKRFSKRLFFWVDSPHEDRTDACCLSDTQDFTGFPCGGRQER